jgi:hypothetical protein
MLSDVIIVLVNIITIQGHAVGFLTIRFHTIDHCTTHLQDLFAVKFILALVLVAVKFILVVVLVTVDVKIGLAGVTHGEGKWLGQKKRMFYMESVAYTSLESGAPIGGFNSIVR